MGHSFEAIEISEVYLQCVAPVLPEVQLGTPLALTPAELDSLGRKAARQGFVTAKVVFQKEVEGLQRKRLDDARQQADALFQGLQGQPFTDVRTFVENDYAYWTWAFCERLAQASRDTAGRSTALALLCAELAVGVAQRVKGVREDWRARLEGFALAHVANAKKVGSAFREAEQAFRQAWELWNRTDRELRDEVLEVAWLLGMEASLLRDQRSFSNSLRLIDQALALARSELAKASLLVAKANTLQHLDDYEGAVIALRQLNESPASGDRRLEWMGQYALADTLRHLGRYSEASQFLPQVWQGVRQWNYTSDLTRVLWLEACVLAGLGYRAEAISKLEQARATFVAEPMVFEAALASLELATLYLEDHRLQEVQRLAVEMTPIFQSRNVHHETLAALKLFCDATHRGEMTAHLARRLAKYLDRARHDPELRFEP